VSVKNFTAAFYCFKNVHLQVGYGFKILATQFSHVALVNLIPDDGTPSGGCKTTITTKGSVVPSSPLALILLLFTVR